MKKKKYLFVVPSLSKGGAERVVSVLASELIKLDREAVVVTHFRAEKEYPLDDNVQVICLSNLGEQEYRNKINALYLVQLAIMLRKEIIKQNPDYILPFLWTTCVRTHFALIGSSFDKKVIQTVRNNPAVFPNNKLMKSYRDLLIRKSFLTIVQNEQQKKYFRKAKHGRIEVLPNPVSYSLTRIERCVDLSEFRIVGVGRLEKQKNFDLLIDVVADLLTKYPNIKLDIYGEGSRETELQSHIDRLDLNKTISLKGRSSDYQEIYGRASLYVLSSDFEGMPNTLLEAMAVGLPCISTDCPTGPSDIIKSQENGILVPVGNKEKLVHEIERLILHEDMRENMGATARHTILMNYMPEKITQRLIDICEV